jgi:hypothetical protein
MMDWIGTIASMFLGGCIGYTLIVVRELNKRMNKIDFWHSQFSAHQKFIIDYIEKLKSQEDE